MKSVLLRGEAVSEQKGARGAVKLATRISFVGRSMHLTQFNSGLAG